MIRGLMSRFGQTYRYCEKEFGPAIPADISSQQIADD